MDNLYVDGSSTPDAERDAEGKTYQLRRLSDGTENRVLKNFPTEQDLGSREELDARNNAKLLSRLGAERSAYYCCLMVMVRHPDDPRPLIAEGIWRGEIARTPRGANGFGYDPLFLLANGKTAAELPPAEKNRISHRALALRRLLELLHAPDHA